MEKQNKNCSNTQSQIQQSIIINTENKGVDNNEEDFLFLYENLDDIKPKRHKSFDIAGYDERHINEIVVVYLFVIKSQAQMKNDPSNQVLLKSFPYDVCSEDTQYETKAQLGRIHYHSLKKYYDYRIDDYKAKLIHYKYVKNDYSWIHNPKTDIVFVNYGIEKAIGCQHYIAGCELECAICKQFFGCRMCHEDMVDDHVFPRYEVEHVKCRYCGCIQKFQQQCQQCGLIFGEQYCGICKIISNLGTNAKPFYHDTNTNVCQIGYPNENVYCEKCNQSYPVEMFSNHNCAIQMEECPICLRNMSNSNYTSIFLNCSHQLHYHCYLQQLSETNLKCPICKQFLPVDYDRESILQFFSNAYKSYFLIPNKYEILLCNDCNRHIQMPFNPYKYCPFCNLFNCDSINYLDRLEITKANYDDFPHKMLEITNENIQKVIEQYEFSEYINFQPNHDLIQTAEYLNDLIYSKQLEQNNQDENESDIVIGDI